jgi:hypothetical protein
MKSPEPTLERTINVLGTTVEFYSNDEFRILTSSLYEAQRVQDWLLAEGVFVMENSE